MKLADLKRLPIGTRLIQVHNLMGPCHKGRTLKKVQSNALLFEPDDKPGVLSYLHLPKASHFRSDENGFSVIEYNGEVGASYVFEKE